MRPTLKHTATWLRLLPVMILTVLAVAVAVAPVATPTDKGTCVPDCPRSVTL